MEQIINDAVIVENFSKVYPVINKYLIENADYVESRNGSTREVIDFKTTITNPYKRCVGNNSRDINIFFLLAEAIWIFKGRKDVAFLDIFNSQMKNYSDDGINFHAPYGFRIRHSGVSSFDNFKSDSPEKNGHHTQQSIEGIDQMLLGLKELKRDPNSRRVVMQIWNSELDLAKDSKDLPCNDMVFFKIRDGKLRTTIANRSNDLHWGLPTNIFQFSFLSEIMSKILDVELGTQTHNSQSLHIYLDSEIPLKMYESYQFQQGKFEDLYDSFEPHKMDMNFDSEIVEARLFEVDFFLDKIIESVLIGQRLDIGEEQELMKFSKYLFMIYDLLFVYLDYKSTTKNNKDKLDSISKISSMLDFYDAQDVFALALNFFASKLPENMNKLKYPIGKL